MADARRPRRRRREPAVPLYAVAKVHLWGRLVGAVAEDPHGCIVFEYDDGFRASGLEISPVHLPLARRGPQEFPELQRSTAFAGLPGVLADALPDAFGNAVIKRFFEQRGTPGGRAEPRAEAPLYRRPRRRSPRVQPSAEGEPKPAPPTEAFTVARLLSTKRGAVIEGDTGVAVPEIMQIGASAGGARAKALVLWNRKRNRVKSAFAAPRPGDEPWMIKFDGVTEGTGGHEVRENIRPGPYGRIEFAYSQLARAAGIEMTETHLLRERDYAHFMTRRFDRVDGRRLHLHSLGGMQHVDYNLRGAFSYEQYFRTIRQLGMGQPSIDQAFRRMAFNLAAVNQDDHVKNFAFLMTPDGRWALSPAFDVTFAHGSEWTRTHQMTLGGKDDGFVRADLLQAGATMDVPNDGADILVEVEDRARLMEALRDRYESRREVDRPD